jgi:hypothetical protein
VKRCQFTVVDADLRARVCGKPATATRAVDGVDLDVCDRCAMGIDMHGPKIRHEEPADTRLPTDPAEAGDAFRRDPAGTLAALVDAGQLADVHRAAAWLRALLLARVPTEAHRIAMAIGDDVLPIAAADPVRARRRLACLARNVDLDKDPNRAATERALDAFDVSQRPRYLVAPPLAWKVEDAEEAWGTLLGGPLADPASADTATRARVAIARVLVLLVRLATGGWDDDAGVALVNDLIQLDARHGTGIPGTSVASVNAAAGLHGGHRSRPPPGLAAEYRALAERWRALCSDKSPKLRHDGEPLAVLILFGLAEPPPYRYTLTGDLILDMLGGLRSFVKDIDDHATEGGGGGDFINGSTIEGWLRRCDAVIEMRARELSAREEGSL